jgi:D-glycero-alpha-D-manno-heptose 1-phosphate guanylyltransferase
MINEAVILAGGMGTRLKEVVPDKPKPMADINGRPFLEYLVNYLAQNTVSRIIFSVGFKADIIINHFKNKFKNIDIEYVIEDIPLGTGGGIVKALGKVTGSDLFIFNGDTLFNIDLEKMARFHESKEAFLTIALKKNENSSRYGSVIIDDTYQIKAFREKKLNAGRELINGGVYLLSKEKFLQESLPEIFSFEKDFLEKYFLKRKFYGMPFDNYFIDIGTPSTYKLAQTDLLNEFNR